MIDGDSLAENFFLNARNSSERRTYRCHPPRRHHHSVHLLFSHSIYICGSCSRYVRGLMLSAHERADGTGRVIFITRGARASASATFSSFLRASIRVVVYPLSLLFLPARGNFPRSSLRKIRTQLHLHPRFLALCVCIIHISQSDLSFSLSSSSSPSSFQRKNER